MLHTRNERSEKHTHGKQYWILPRFNNLYVKWQLLDKVPSWKRFTRKVPSWKQIRRKLPSWAKHPFIINAYTRIRQNIHPTRDVKTYASTMDWPSAMKFTATFSVYLLFFGLYIFWFNKFIYDLASFVSGVEGSSWSFGQVVAIMVWMEPLCEYFHLELR